MHVVLDCLYIIYSMLFDGVCPDESIEVFKKLSVISKTTARVAENAYAASRMGLYGPRKVFLKHIKIYNISFQEIYFSDPKICIKHITCMPIDEVIAIAQNPMLEDYQLNKITYEFYCFGTNIQFKTLIETMLAQDLSVQLDKMPYFIPRDPENLKEIFHFMNFQIFDVFDKMIPAQNFIECIPYGMV